MYNFDFDMPPLDWRVTFIPKEKKPGEFRKLTIPNDRLKEVQKQILDFLQQVPGLRPSIYAHGFIKYRSTLTGVIRHNRRADVLLCADVKDFFDTFPVEPVRQRLLENNIGSKLTEKIITACTYKGTLPQGSPCSPMLTNIGMYETDLMIGAYAQRHGFTYTRYADDLTFSQLFEETGNNPRKRYYGFYKGLDKLLHGELHIKLNPEKCHTIWLDSVASRRVTGIVIRNDGTGYNAPRKMRKQARAMLHNLYMKIKTSGGRIEDGDWIAWMKLYGYVKYMDYIRSASEQPSCTADGFINAEKFAYLKELFCGRKQ